MKPASYCATGAFCSPVTIPHSQRDPSQAKTLATFRSLGPADQGVYREFVQKPGVGTRDEGERRLPRCMDTTVSASLLPLHEAVAQTSGEVAERVLSLARDEVQVVRPASPAEGDVHFGRVLSAEIRRRRTAFSGSGLCNSLTEKE